MEGKSGSGKEVREAIKNMTDGCPGNAKGMMTLQDLIVELMQEYDAEGSTFGNPWTKTHHSSLTGQKARVIVWSGNGLATNNDDMRLIKEPGPNTMALTMSSLLQRS